MCGLAGFVNMDGAPADVAVLAAMTDLVRHRGPDDRGLRCVSLRGAAADTALGVQRLKILDLSGQGHQPMVDDTAGVVVLFNGAIYNASGQRTDLERNGYRFRSATDTEVILALYERAGLDGLLERLEGMFAIAIADTRQGLVHLIRDRVGIKPLYWTQCGTTLLFASESKAFLAHPGFRPRVDPNALDDVLAFRYAAGAASILEGVQQVPPGHCLTISPSGLRQHRYWSIPDAHDPGSLPGYDAVDRLDQLLERSVQAQLRSDVPLGCQLSGGIDSSLVSVFAGRHTDAAPEAFSIVVNDPRFSEARWIGEAAAAAGAVSHRFLFNETDFVEALDAASWHMDQPLGHPNSLALWLLARRSREHVTVLLSGEGADELFGGYRRAVDAGRPASGAPGHLDAVGRFIEATQFHSRARLAKLRPSASLSAVIEKRRAIFEQGDGGGHLARCLAYDMRTHLVDLLARQDRMMMAHGVENRVPFLDRHIIDFARTLPADLLAGPAVSNGQPASKVVVKALARRYFDLTFVGRRKSAFNLPLAQYFRGQAFVELMEDRLLPGMAKRGLVDVGVVRRWWRRALSAPSTTEGFWIPVALELWAQQFLDGAGRRGHRPAAG